MLIVVSISPLIVSGCNRSNDPTAQTQPSQSSQPSAAERMQAAADARDWELAEKHARQALIENPDDPDILTQAAGITAVRDRKREAAAMLAEAARMANYQPASRVDLAVRGLTGVGEVYSAIELLEASLREHPDRDEHRKILVGFWNEVQRTEKIGQHLQKLIEHRHFDLRLLLSTTETSSRRLSEKTSERLLKLNPTDKRVRLAEAFLLLSRRNSAEAGEVLEEILEHHPDFAPAHAMFGQVLTGEGRWDELAQWLQDAPADSQDFSDYWLTLGDYALRRAEPPAAVRAYWEATRRDPHRNQAWDRLRLATAQLRQSESPLAARISSDQQQIIANHADRSHALRDAFNDFSGHKSQTAISRNSSQTAAARIARGLFEVGRVWEAEAWSALATTFELEPDRDLNRLREEIVRQLARDPSWISTETPAIALDFSFLPLPELDGATRLGSNERVVPSVSSHDHIRLAEHADQWGMQGIGDGNDPSDPVLAPLIRSTGMGGGAIDYNLDGLPDLVLINAGGAMLQSDSHPNELLQNVGERFVRVSDVAGVNGTRFGQGVAVGDFNEDGFPDLFIANLGLNRLLRNNGDGTFTDCSQLLEADSKPDQWSTSAAFVDINGDTISDLIVTRYCRAVPHLDQACENEQGKPGPCHPMMFPADTDQFFVGTDDGRLVDVTADWIGKPVEGRGLGILAGTLDNQQLGVFVANDMTRNSYYTPSEDQNTTLIDSASARGLAVDGRSLAQASMGIAASDFDLDGDLDLYVTGFGREYNIYYEQVVPGMWKDETARLNLVEPTLPLVGFGTQAVDFDNDGIDEIVVTNGNIGQFSEPGAGRYEQPLQVFRRSQDGRFALLDDDDWGDYFRKDHVGRAVWTIDVNRDGRNDLMVTHTREQVGLLVNQTPGGNRVAFQLVATDCSRDAIGAVIRFRSGGVPRTLWMLSGDGYFCSNEKTRMAGIGEVNEVTDVTVTWQDGSVDELGSLPGNTQYLIVQGTGEAYPLHHYPKPR